jgi:hypothetical protein
MKRSTTFCPMAEGVTIAARLVLFHGLCQDLFGYMHF